MTSRRSLQVAGPLVVLGLAAAAILLVPVARLGAQGQQQGPALDEVSYAIGHDLGREIAAGLAQDQVEADPQTLVQGFADGLRGEHSMLSEDEIEDVLVEFNRIIKHQRAAERLESDPVYKAIHETNLKKSRTFLERFAKREGAKSIEGGIPYLVIQSADGRSPTREDTVLITFRALLVDGLEIASGTNVSLRIDSMEEGFQRVVTAMDVGDHWYVAVPPELAFGKIGRSPDVGPNEAIVADIKLIAISPRAE